MTGHATDLAYAPSVDLRAHHTACLRRGIGGAFDEPVVYPDVCVVVVSCGIRDI